MASSEWAESPPGSRVKWLKTEVHIVRPSTVLFFVTFLQASQATRVEDEADQAAKVVELTKRDRKAILRGEMLNLKRCHDNVLPGFPTRAK
jgi:hypothetical protein